MMQVISEAREWKLTASLKDEEERKLKTKINIQEKIYAELKLTLSLQ